VLLLTYFPLELPIMFSSHIIFEVFKAVTIKASSAMLRLVALVRTDVSEELSASIIRVTRIVELGTLAVTSNRRTLSAAEGFQNYRKDLQVLYTEDIMELFHSLCTSCSGLFSKCVFVCLGFLMLLLKSLKMPSPLLYTPPQLGRRQKELA
jgi:hypothetical protein